MNENPILTLELAVSEINILLAALQEVPAKICNPLSEKIREQAQKQIPGQPEPEAASEVKGTYQ